MPKICQRLFILPNALWVLLLLFFNFGCGRNIEYSATTELFGDHEHGLVLYNENCVFCHGENGVGNSGYAPRLSTPGLLYLANDRFFVRTILEGRPGTAMMGYDGMLPDEGGADDLVALFRMWQRKYLPPNPEIIVDWEGTIQGNRESGQGLYAKYCAACHGQEGEGYQAGGSGLAIGQPGFLSVASDDFIKQTILYGRAGTAMKAFGGRLGLVNLSDSEINDVVSYLRGLE